MTAMEIDRWHEIAKDAYRDGKTFAEVTEMLRGTFPTLTYDQVRGYLVRQKMKGFFDSDAEQVSSPETSTPNPPLDEVENAPATVEMRDGNTTFSRIIKVMEGETVTPEKLMTAHGLDETLWEVVSYKNNFWQAQKRGGKTIILYQSKLTVKPRRQLLPTFADFKKHFENFRPKYKPDSFYAPISPKADTMFEINIADLHLGKLAWVKESGESYDYKIARKRFDDIIDQEIARMKTYPVEEILFVWSNDFFNSDGINETTTGGTPQNDDLRWQKMFFVGCEMLVNAITKLSAIAPVKTFLIASNHSRQVEFYTCAYLSAWFKDDRRVTVDTNCQTRYYYRYGTNLIGFSHSSYENKKQLPVLMQVEAAEDWGQTTYREFHLAHYHSERVDESGGIIFRWLPSVTGPDAWHESCGFIGAVQRSYTFIWNKKKGLVGINVDYPLDRNK